MNALPPGALALIDELCNVLDREIVLLDLRCIQLAGLSRASIERDDEGMETLLREIETTHLSQESTDREVDAIRRRLGRLLDWPMDRTRLGALVGALEGDRRRAVARRREQIMTLMSRLKHQHMATALVVAESARINRMLLASLCPRSSEVTTYGAGGERSWRPASPLVDVES